MTKRERQIGLILSQIGFERLELDNAIEGYLLSLELENRAPLTLADYRGALQRFTWYLKMAGHPTNLAELNSGHVKSFLNYLQERGRRWGMPRNNSSQRPASAATVGKYRTRLHGFWAWAIREELVTTNPVDMVRAPRTERKLVEGLTQEEVRALVTACRQGISHHLRRDLAIILLMLDTGLRVTELCTLTVQQWQQSQVRVMGKGRKERWLPLSAVTSKSVWDYVSKERPATQFYNEIFLSEDGMPLDRFSLARILRRRAQEAGLHDVNPHKLRHTFALSWCKSGGPLSALQTLLGHESPSMSLRYGQMAARDVSELHRQFSPVERLGLRLRDKR